MDLDKVTEGIKSTGFKLEFDISELLQKHGWNVINNKYYVDDLQETIREIDLVSYKATKVLHFYIYTVLIVSCKKNEKDAWALLSKKRNPSDPNTEWLPVHAWSNDRALDYVIKDKGWKDNYLSCNNKNGSSILSKIPENHIFAFQEVSKATGKANNDKNIFNSITSLMKAQAYEMNALPVRKKDPSIFQFNLISVVDSNLLRSEFSSNGIRTEEIEEEVYVAEYIIDKKQTSAKIHFIKASSFEGALKQYNLLHSANVLSFKEDYLEFYSGIERSYSRQSVFLGDIQKDMLWRINSSLRKMDKKPIGNEDISLFWDEKSEVLELGICSFSFDADILNRDKTLLEALKLVLKTHLKYDGSSKFSEGIPF